MTKLEYNKALYIDGRWTTPDAGGRIEVENPATGQVLTEIDFGDEIDARNAVNAAALAFSAWSCTPARQRADALLRVAKTLRERADSIGRVLAMESGKRLPEAVAEIQFSSEYFRWFAEEARRPSGEWMPQEDPHKRHYARYHAAGVAVCLSPWNFPVSIQARKVAPALAAGCTVVARGSQKTPLSVIELFRCMEEAGFPPGVVNLVNGSARQTTAGLLDHPAVRIVSFTGSTAVGQSLVVASAKRMQRLALELGGNAPFLVFADANLDMAMEAAMIAKFRNNGQSCIAANRFLVQRSVYEEFIDKFRARLSTMRLGNPIGSEDVDLGPMIDGVSRDNLTEWISDATKEGARPIIDSIAAPENGYFLPPTILTDVPPHMAFASGELFGPAAPVIVFDDEDEGMAMANRCDMGLAAYVFTESHARAVRVTEGLEYGIIALNHALPSVAFAPMGGWKMSGLGREGGRIGIEEFMEMKYVSTWV